MSTRLTVSVAAAGLTAFALLYTPQPVLPQIAAEYGLASGGASLAVSAATGALALVVVPVAALSQRVGRRPVILVSVLAAALFGLLLPFAPNYETFLAIRVLQGAAVAGVPAAAMAYLADELRENLGGAVGAMVAGNSAGGMIGRLLAGTTADWLGWRNALLATAVFGALCAVVVVFFLPKAAGRPRRDRGLRQAMTDPVLLCLYGVAVLAVGSFISLYNVVGFRLAGLPSWLSSLVFLVYAVGSVASATAGRLADRYGRGRVMLLCLAIAGAGALLTIPVVPLGLAVFTAGFFAAHATASGWVGARAPESARGQASGLYLCGFYVGSSVLGTTGSTAFGAWGWSGLVALVLGWLAVAAVLVQKSRGIETGASSALRSTLPSLGRSSEPSFRPSDTDRTSAGTSTTIAVGSTPPS
ncbi:MFS transporter [Lentzea sp. NBRC 105346]|uniref:MFS transporter n=1 Tax=Lentzea sp. NBRC 105346 TaxID=3032205 RepID=UPI0025525E3B|nr:MFS transporter [Lentzea sp. NBRC 105346]